MEMKKSRKAAGNVKAQMFSLTSLIFVLLMIFTLLVFVIMSVGYDNLSEASVLSSSSSNYGAILTKSADTFAYASGSAAISTLFKYEYNASMRKDNFITNMSYFMQSLMVNGQMPNVIPGSTTAAAINAMMGNAVFASYNSEVNSLTGISSKQIIINQTPPQIYQSSPYSINIQYTENVQINTSTATYNFDIPVNVTIPLNNTPDLFYAQQGVYKLMKFANPQYAVTNIGNAYATSGNTVGFTYGQVYVLPSTTTCPPALPVALSSPPYSTHIILVDANAVALTTPACSSLSNYGGLITGALNVPPAAPYLVYSSSSNVIPLLQNNEPVLLYGPSLSTLNISNLQADASSQAYFASPFVASYFDRLTGNFQRQSADGIFTLFPYDRQAGVFSPPLNSNIVSQNLPTSTKTLTVSAWVNPNKPDGNRGIVGQADSGAADNWNLKVFGTGGGFDFVIYHSIDASFGTIALNQWQMVTAIYNSGNINLYVNGNQVATYSAAGSPSLSTNLPLYIGVTPGDGSPYNFNGEISNVQVYNGVLTNSQVYSLYQQGIEGLPAANVPLIGWWPLNGNGNDYSGYPDKDTPTNVMYSQLGNYNKDSAYVQPYPSNTYPIPGLLSCNSQQQCFSTNAVTVNLGNAPLSLGNGALSAAYFNGVSSYINAGSGSPLNIPTGKSATMCAWVDSYNPTASSYQEIMAKRTAGAFEYGINFIGSTFQVFTSPSGSGVSGFSYTLPKGQWTFVCGVIAASAPTALYINGASYGTSGIGGGVVSGSDNFEIGAYGSGVEPFNGLISNVQVYNTTLTPTEISTLYLDGINSRPVDTFHLIGWWPLNGNANDTSNYGNNGASYSMSYQLIQMNYSQYSGVNSIGLFTPGATSNEWQTFGFPAPP